MPNEAEITRVQSAKKSKVEQPLLAIGEAIRDAEALVDAMQRGADAAREAGSNLTDAATEIEDGAGHETERSTAIQEKGEALAEWADTMDELADNITNAMEALADAIDAAQNFDEHDGYPDIEKAASMTINDILNTF